MNSPDPQAPPVRRSLAASVGWASAGQFGAQAVNFVAILVLPVWLEPELFGVAGFALAVIAVLDMLVDFGTGSALVQREEVRRETVDTAFSINLLFGAVGTAVCALIGGGLLWWGEQRHLAGVVVLELAPASLFTALATVPRALLTRDMRLDTVAKISLVGAVARAAVSITFASLGFGVQCLVLGFYASAIWTVAAYLLVVRRPLRLGWSAAERGPLLGFGARLTAFNVTNTVMLQADAFLLVGLLGEGAFGLFSYAKRLLLQPVEMAGSVVRAVLFPQLSRLQGSLARSRVYYLRSEQLLVLFMALPVVGAAANLDLLASTLLSEKWLPVVPLALPLLPAALVMMLLQCPGSLLLARGHSGELVRWGLLRGGVLVAGYATSAFLGLRGMSLCLAGLLVAAFPLLLARPAQVLGVRPWTFLAALGQLAPACVAAFGAVQVSRWLLRTGDVALSIQLVISCVAAALGYLAVLLVQRPPAWRVVLRNLRRWRRSRRAAADARGATRQPGASLQPASAHAAGAQPAVAQGNEPVEFSVVIPAHNRAKVIARAIESAARQGLRPAEILVVDDGSSDDTAAVARATGLATVIEQHNQGASVARNTGVLAARSRWIAFLDSDDIWCEGHLERMAAAITGTGGRAGVYFADIRETQEAGGQLMWERAGFRLDEPYRLTPDARDWALLTVQPMMLQSSVFDRRTFLDAGGLRPELRCRHDTHAFLVLGIGRPVCAVAGCGTVMTSDDTSGGRVTEAHGVETAGYWQETVIMYSEVLAQHRARLLPRQRVDLGERLALAHLRLSRFALHGRGLGGLPAALGHAAQALRRSPRRFFTGLGRWCLRL